MPESREPSCPALSGCLLSSFLVANVLVCVLVCALFSPSPAAALTRQPTYAADDERGDVLRHDPDLLTVRVRATGAEVVAVVMVYGAGAEYDVGFALTSATGVYRYVTPEAVGGAEGPLPECVPTFGRRSRPHGERFVLRAPIACLRALGSGPLRVTVRLFQKPMYPEVAFRVVDSLELSGVRLVSRPAGR